jgi:hypothetical protein
MERITRTAPGWEERTVTLLASAARAVDGAGASALVRPGFARLAFLLDVTAYGGGTGLKVWIQHSPDGARWLDLAAFALVTAAGPQIAWLEAQPELESCVAACSDGAMAAGTVHEGFVMPRLRVKWSVGGAVTHTFGVELVAIYAR